MKLILLPVLLLAIIFTSCSSSEEQENFTTPSYMKGCKYNDGDFDNLENEHEYLFCFYSEENNIIKISMYNGNTSGSGPVNVPTGDPIENYSIDLNNALISGSGFNYTVISEGTTFKFKFSSNALDQNESGYYQRVTVTIGNNKIYFKPHSCSIVENYIPN